MFIPAALILAGWGYASCMAVSKVVSGGGLYLGLFVAIVLTSIALYIS